MRAILIAIVAALPVVAQAQSIKPKKSDRTMAPASKPLPLKGAARGNGCAEYGAGFVRVEGSDTCMRIGGALSVGGGFSSGGR